LSGSARSPISTKEIKANLAKAAILGLFSFLSLASLVLSFCPEPPEDPAVFDYKILKYYSSFCVKKDLLIQFYSLVSLCISA